MVELCLTGPGPLPSAARISHPEQGLFRAPPKEFQPFLPNHCAKPEIVRSGCLQFKSYQLEDPWMVMRMLSGFNQSLGSIIGKPVLVDVQDVRPDSVFISFGIAEQCMRHERNLWFLMSRCNEPCREDIDISLISDLMGPCTFSVSPGPQPFLPSDSESCLYEIGEGNIQPFLFYPKRPCNTQDLSLGIPSEMDRNSMISAHPNGRFLLSSTEMKALLSIISEFYPSKSSIVRAKQPVLVPLFTRLDDIHGSSPKLQTVSISPVKSPEKIKLRPSPRKKHTRKTGRERDLYRKSYFHACESLLSAILNKQHGKIAVHSLKKSGQQLPKFLTQFSTGIAGTGLAVIFSVLCKVAGGRAPFCANKLLNTGFGFGLVWLSWAVNGLGDTIVSVCKNSKRVGLKEEDVLGELNKSLNEVFFRAATLMAVAVLRFA